MVGKKAKQQLAKNDARNALKQGNGAEAVAPQQTGKNDKVEASSRELVWENGDLPESYGENRVMLLPVGPFVVHAYWEFHFRQHPSPSAGFERVKQRPQDDPRQTRPVLRFYDVSNIVFNGENAHSFFDVDIDLAVQNQYVHLWSPEKEYLAEIGFRAENDKFFPAARSNIVETPRAWPVPDGDEQYLFVAEETGGAELTTEVREESLRDGQTAAEKQPPKEKIQDALPASDQAALFRLGESTPGLPKKNQPFRKVVVKIRPSIGPENSRPQNIHARHAKEKDHNLTDVCEARFSFGVSSK